MIRISREEAIRLRQRLPSTLISVTSRQGPRRKKTYYAEESQDVLQQISAYRHLPKSLLT